MSKDEIDSKAKKSPVAQENADLDSRLIDAVLKERVAEVASLIEQKADVNVVRDEDGQTPIMYSRNLEIIQKLIDAGADGSVRDDKGNNILVYDTFSTIDKVKMLLENYPELDIDGENNDGENLLTSAALTLDVTAVNSLLEIGVNVNFVNRKGETPLLRMLNSDWDESEDWQHGAMTIKTLIDSGAYLNEQDDNGEFRILSAAQEVLLRDDGPPETFTQEDVNFIQVCSLAVSDLQRLISTLDLTADLLRGGLEDIMRERSAAIAKETVVEEDENGLNGIKKISIFNLALDKHGNDITKTLANMGRFDLVKEMGVKFLPGSSSVSSSSSSDQSDRKERDVEAERRLHAQQEMEYKEELARQAQKATQSSDVKSPRKKRDRDEEVSPDDQVSKAAESEAAKRTKTAASSSDNLMDETAETSTTQDSVPGGSPTSTTATAAVQSSGQARE